MDIVLDYKTPNGYSLQRLYIVSQGLKSSSLPKWFEYNFLPEMRSSRGKHLPRNLLTNIQAGCNGAITQTSTDGKLHNVSRVQFSFSNNNTILSESVKQE
jgi:hypothetical protein